MSESSNTPTILVVDDEQLTYKVVSSILQPHGFSVAYAPGGTEALTFARHGTPDVVLLDVMMPGMNGYEVARALKASKDTSEIPIVVMTSLDGADERVRAIEAGADDFLAKPVDITELRARVKSLVTIKASRDRMKSYQTELEQAVEAKTRELRIATEAIKASALDTLYRLSTASEFKDQNTKDHIDRVSLYTEVIAMKLGLPAHQVEELKAAAPMHDIGKLGIPDPILLKAGPLTPTEWDTMKTHTTTGAQMLSGSRASVIQLAETIALSHHERWDGKGYPAGLKGEAIPLAARIVAVADVFDALSSRRPYRTDPPMAALAVLAHIEAGRGTHFDPAVVDALLASKDEVLLIREAHDVEATMPPQTASGLATQLVDVLGLIASSNSVPSTTGDKGLSANDTPSALHCSSKSA